MRYYSDAKEELYCSEHKMHRDFSLVDGSFPFVLIDVLSRPSPPFLWQDVETAAQAYQADPCSCSVQPAPHRRHVAAILVGGDWTSEQG